MKSDFHDMPEKTVREGDNSYFLYHDNDGGSKVTVYHKYTKALHISINPLSRTVTCLSTGYVTYADLFQVEKLLKGILPEEVLLLELLQDAIKSKDGRVVLSY
jgi:hypothetical protein